MKSLARKYVWWPHLESDIKQCVKHCYPCQSHRNGPAKEPLHHWEWPTEPWQKIHLDYAGPMKGCMILIVMDAHTKWIDADLRHTASSNATIERLRQCFTTHGLPCMIVTDNGTCFSSSEFNEFTCLNDIIHKFVSPHHQASNGLSQRFVSFVKSGLNKIHGGSLLTRLSHLLFTHHITPHTTTGVTTAELLMKRRLRIRLDCLRPVVALVTSQNQWKQRLHHDKHAVQHSINIRDQVFVKKKLWSRKGLATREDLQK